MSMTNIQITSPLLRLLIDEDPHLMYDKVSLREMGFEELKNDIQTNLEMILNTRRPHVDFLKYLSEIEHSILNYGIIDFTQSAYGLRQNQIKLCHSLEKAIAYFEPRLQCVHVVILMPQDNASRHFLIRIESIILLKPEPRPAMFTSQVDVIRHQFSFEEEKS
jgi:type VI secretion system protein ImpF